MVEKVAFVNKWPMLMKATSDDETPTPGYLYKEVSDLSYVSTGYCTSLLSFLVERLEKSSFHIKVKALRVLKHVVEHGHNDFKIGLRRQALGIQNACKYSGDPDLLHGNAPYVAVRKAAMELSEVLFDTEQPKSPKRSGDGKVKSAVDPSKIQGFGYSPTHQPHAAKSLTEVIKGGVEQLASNLTNLSTDHRDGRTQTSDYRPITGFQSTSQRPKMSFVDYRSSNRSSDRPGGSWAADHHVGSHGSNDSSGQKSGASTDMSEKLASVAVEDWSQEIKLVEDFVSFSNVKATPSREELNQFSKRCATSSSEKVLELLDKKLPDNSQHNMQMRSLCAIEGIIREDLVSVEKAQEMLQTNLRLLLNSQDRLVQAKAKKISKQLERLLLEANETLQTSRTSPLHQGTTTQLLHNLVQISPQEEVLPSLMLANHPQQEALPSLMLANQAEINPTETRPESNSLFSGMSFGQQKCDLSVGQDGDPFGIRAASNTNSKPQSVLGTKPKDPCQDDILLNLGRKSGGQNINDHVLTGAEDGVLLSTLEHSSSAKETVLDTILDLSSTEQTTLEPVQSGINTVLVSNRTSGHKTSDSCILPVQTGPGGGPVKMETVSVASRTSYVDDLLASVDPLTKLRTSDKDDRSLASSASSVPVNPTQHASKDTSMEDITRLFPQLSQTQLSGTSAVPLSLAKKPQMNNFAFVETEEDKKEKRTKKGQEDAFGFVHDAMAKASKR
ncbi:AP-4 complex accessory subunit tepsin-like [Amphiura filiformis]|uniref:AP-4 complex accessory subunit tepsin-like n=1 Tax=Amphiura filiformis TaxID=82378 RepID=UPI003B22239A